MTELLITLLFTILPPCQHEDSSWCTWVASPSSRWARDSLGERSSHEQDAQSQGNGQGASYVALWPRDPVPLTITLD